MDKPKNKTTTVWKGLRVKEEANTALGELRRLTGERYTSEAIVKAVEMIKQKHAPTKN